MDPPQSNNSPDPDVSPKTATVPDPKISSVEYFSAGQNAAEGPNTSGRTSEADRSSERRSSVSFASQTTKLNESIASSAEENTTQHSAANNDERRGSQVEPLARKASTSSVKFRQPRNLSLPQGNQKQTDASRIRASSPPPNRFQRRVAFDNIPIGEATKHNIPGLSLCTKHNGFQARRTSRTFMVGVDENNYSDYALQWLLDELIDDGDEIICVRVIEREIRAQDKQYQADAQALMRNIEEKTGDNRAISITLEFTTGKLHDTFQRLIHIYKPAMLIVGTRGRSLGGIQGLVNTRNSFSKYCLQYSPVPVIIVRPTEKRIKKKTKRANDATRRTYVAMLAASDGVHEADSDARVTYQLESNITAEEEAHQVAKELGLPASFDPTIKPLQYTPPAKVRPQERRALTPSSTQTGADSDSESEDEDGGFEAVSGQEALQNQQNVERQQKLEALHKMEVGEAAALRMPVNDDSDDDDDDENDDANVQAQAQAGAGVS